MLQYGAGYGEITPAAQQILGHRSFRRGRCVFASVVLLDCWLVCLFICQQDKAKATQQILMKYWPRKLA